MENVYDFRIRKLTPRECWRLMDFTDEDFEKAAEVNSNTQLYKQAGNSIIRNVLVAILGQMIPGKEEVYKIFKEETNMKETTIITTVEITEVIKDMPECFTLDKEAEANHIKQKVKEALNADDVVVTNVQEFEMEKE